MPDAPSICVHLLPALIPAGALDGGVAVVIDVLRATTMMTHALAAGCREVFPCLEIDDARSLAASLPEGTALLAGERKGVPIEGFDLGNSPRSCTPAKCQGKALIITTTNGTRALIAAVGASHVLVAGFVNLTATVKRIADLLNKAPKRVVHIVCAGTDGEVSFEDTLVAGRIVDLIRTQHPDAPMNDAARIADDVQTAAMARELASNGATLVLAEGQGGWNLVELGFLEDIKDCRVEDRFPIAVELRRDPLRLVVAGRG